MATEDVPLQGIIFCGLCEAWSTSVSEVAHHQIVRCSGPATHLWFRVLLLALHLVRAFFACRAQTASRCFSMSCCFTAWLSDLFPVTTFRYLLLCLIIVSGVRNTSTALPFATIQLKDSLPEPFWHRHSHFDCVFFARTVIREVCGPTRTALRSMAAMLLVWQTRQRLQL